MRGLNVLCFLIVLLNVALCGLNVHRGLFSVAAVNALLSIILTMQLYGDLS
jgi:hypothetical protein